MTSTTTEYTTLLERAQRNFALCVVQIQNDLEPFQRGWREKADRLKDAIRRAELLASAGIYGTACNALKLENEPK